MRVATRDRQERQVRRFYDAVWNRRDMAVIPEILAPDVSFRGSLGPTTRGHAAFAAYVRDVTGALADYSCQIDALVGDGDAVVTRMRFAGTHRGPLLGFAATGRRVSWAGAAFFTFTGDLVQDLWVLGDLHDLHRQLAGEP